MFINHEKLTCDWNMKDKDNQYYYIVTINMEWEDKLTYAHFIHDITREKHEQDRLHQQAKIDA